MRNLRLLHTRWRAGSALVMTMIMTGVALAILAGAMTWSANSTRLTHRSIQYSRTVVAAEGATEKVLTRMTRDFLSGGEKAVQDNLTGYRQLLPTAADSAFWNHWQFNDAAGNVGRLYIERRLANKYIVIDSTYAGLRGFVSTYAIAAHARDTAALQEVDAGVVQEIQLARIPVFQFAMYSSGDMEISCGQPFNVTGRVHSNQQLYVEPDNALTFQSDVTAVNDILFQRHPLDTRGAPSGSAVYQAKKNSKVAAMTLPIGTTNTPEAIREIIQPPPVGEDPNSPLGRVRYYNQADLILTVSDAGLSASSQKYNSGAVIPIPTNQLAAWVSTTNSFYDARESKTVQPIDIDVQAMATWSESSGNLNAALGGAKLSSIYVLDTRTLASDRLAAVRVWNGMKLPANGLTVATARPLYVWGNYNQTTANLGTTNTSTTLPASLVADAVTILSVNWTDTNSHALVAARGAGSTTVNAALLTGVVETAKQPAPLTGYSGGMENFPRFLETWGSANVFTYNGSMVRMFPSRYATNAWGKTNVYAPPKRNWAFDANFDDSTKLPPLTPSLVKVIRGQWATVAPGVNTLAEK